ncbi:MAG: hypothetical protein IJ064_05685 [Bacteroidaceae bacterium]|nr:hypothetical protein [Bacteroidaceae bacterium]
MATNEQLENRVRSRAYYQKNREKCIAQQMAYYWRNRVTILEKNKERWRRNYENETEKERENRLAHERVLRMQRKNGNYKKRMSYDRQGKEERVQ